MKEVKQIYPKNIDEWRKWLDKNHIKESKVAVIRYKKHTGKNSPSHLELMHEAICFGWIDTTIKRLDEDKYIINFSKRNDKSRWSSNTLSYGKKMIELGKMAEEGMKHYLAGLKRPTLDSEVSKNPRMPSELKERLKKSNAEENFNKFAPSYRRTLLRYLERAKLPETREKRIGQIVQRSIENKKSW